MNLGNSGYLVLWRHPEAEEDGSVAYTFGPDDDNCVFLDTLEEAREYVKKAPTEMYDENSEEIIPVILNVEEVS